jgi:hypothetical protein
MCGNDSAKWPAHLSGRAYGTITEGAASLLSSIYLRGLTSAHCPILQWVLTECM